MTDSKVETALVPAGPDGVMSVAEVRKTPGYLMRRAHQFANAAYAAEIGTSELTGVQFVALLVVREEPGLTSVRIAERLGYDKMTTSRVLRGLERKGYIGRNASLGDRREILIDCTPAGERIAAQVSVLLPIVRERVLQPLTTDESTILMALLEKLEQASRGALDPGAPPDED